MSALERLIARYQRDLYKPEREHLRREEFGAMQMYNDIAHELAEKIRAGIDYDSGNATPDYIAGATDGADLIDPEVPE